MPISYSKTYPLNCFKCGIPSQFKLWHLVDAQERPDLWDLCKSGDLNLVRCPNGHGFYVMAALLLHDGVNKKLIYVNNDNAPEEANRAHCQDLVQRLKLSLPPNVNRDYLDVVHIVRIDAVKEALEENDNTEAILYNQLRYKIQCLQKPSEMPERIRFIQQALEIIKQAETHDDYSWLIGMLGNSYFRLEPRNDENIENAIHYVGTALSMLDPSTQPRIYAENIINLAIFHWYRQRGNAIENLSYALDLLYSLQEMPPGYFESPDVQNRIVQIEEELTGMTEPVDSTQSSISQVSPGTKNVATALIDKIQKLKQGNKSNQAIIDLIYHELPDIEKDADAHSIAMVHVMLATHLQEGSLQQQRQATQVYEKILERFPDFSQKLVVCYKLAEAFLNLFKSQFVQEYLEEARVLFEQLSRRPPKEIPQIAIVFGLGQCYADRTAGDPIKNFEFAQKYTGKAEQLSGEGHWLWRDIIHTLATIYYKFRHLNKNNTEKAIDYFEKTIGLYGNDTDNMLVIETYELLIELIWESKGNFTDLMKAIDYWKRIGGERRYQRDKKKLSHYFYKGALIHCQAGEFKKEYVFESLKLYQRALDFTDFETEPDFWADIQIGLGKLYLEFGDESGANFEKAIECFEAVMNHFSPNDHQSHYFKAGYLLATAFDNRQLGEKQNNLALAKQLIKKLLFELEIDESKQAHKYKPHLLGQLGSLYLVDSQDDRISWEEAEHYLLEATALSDDHAFNIQMKINLGQLYLFRDNSDAEQAIHILKKALTDFNKVPDKETKRSMVVLGNIYMKLGDSYLVRKKGNSADNIEQAINFYDKGLHTCRIFEERNELYRPAYFQWLLGGAYQKRLKGDANENKVAALSFYRKAFGFSCVDNTIQFDNQLSVQEFFIIAANYSSLLIELKRWEEGYQLCTEALQKYDLLYEGMLTEKGKRKQRILNNFFDDMVWICYNRGITFHKECFSVAEKSKSQLLREAFGSLDVPYPESIPRTLVELEINLRETCNTLLRSSRPEDIESLKKTQAQLYNLWEEWEVRYKAFDYVSFRKGEALSFTEIQQWLTKRSLNVGILAFYTLEYATLGFLLRKNEEPKVVALPIKKAEITEFYEILNVELQLTPPESETWRELGQKLFAKEIFDGLENLDALYVIPHGLLHCFPIHALQFESRTLIEYVPVYYAPSSSIAVSINKHQKDLQQKMLVIGNPSMDLPYSEKEAIVVANLLQTSPLIGSAVKKQTLLERMGNATIIHIASHAYFDQTNPFHSGIFLANEEILTAEELNKLHLSAELICLSGCQSGTQDVSHGDELYGLARSLLYAGASSLHLSLWEVNDAFTAEFMKRFYTEVTGRASDRLRFGRSFQRTLISILKDGNVPSFYWAPYFLYGAMR